MFTNRQSSSFTTKYGKMYNRKEWNVKMFLYAFAAELHHAANACSLISIELTTGCASKCQNA